jgi:hypothetical protein
MLRKGRLAEDKSEISELTADELNHVCGGGSVQTNRQSEDMAWLQFQMSMASKIQGR